MHAAALNRSPGAIQVVLRRVGDVLVPELPQLSPADVVFQHDVEGAVQIGVDLIGYNG